MRASEYIDKAIAFIADTARALEVRRELEAHLKEAAAEVEAQGIDPETAELVAVARMGDPERVALDLAEAHHQNLPWRHYLAIIPALVLLFGRMVEPNFWRWPGGTFWFPVLAVCLVPNWATWKRWSTRLRLDAFSKLRWVQRQPLGGPLLAGIAAGGVAGLLFTVGLFTLSRHYWGGFPTVLFFVFLLPLSVSIGTLDLFRSRSPALLAAGFAALVFPMLCLPAVLMDGGPPALVAGFTVSGGYAFLILGAGWAIDRVAAKRQAIRT